jgi:hypothetical protein
LRHRCLASREPIPREGSHSWLHPGSRSRSWWVGTRRQLDHEPSKYGNGGAEVPYVFRDHRSRHATGEVRGRSERYTPMLVSIGSREEMLLVPAIQFQKSLYVIGCVQRLANRGESQVSVGRSSLEDDRWLRGNTCDPERPDLGWRKATFGMPA